MRENTNSKKTFWNIFKVERIYLFWETTVLFKPKQMWYLSLGGRRRGQKRQEGKYYISKCGSRELYYVDPEPHLSGW